MNKTHGTIIMSIRESYQLARLNIPPSKVKINLLELIVLASKPNSIGHEIERVHRGLNTSYSTQWHFIELQLSIIIDKNFFDSRKKVTFSGPVGET